MLYTVIFVIHKGNGCKHLDKVWYLSFLHKSHVNSESLRVHFYNKYAIKDSH